MKKAATVVVLLSALLLLAGCASETAAPAPVALAKSTVDPRSTPGFLSIPQAAADDIPSTVGGVRSDSTRYQGTVNGTKIYLGLDLGSHVEIIHRLAGGWVQADGSRGNVVFGSGLPHGDWVQYVPQGATSKTLAGWVPLSKYILVKKN